jgi:hypothetical protein
MRYIFLVTLNLPVILLAIANIVTLYKMNKISKLRFRTQLTIWILTLIVLIGSFPVYNHFAGAPIFDSHDLSLLDVIQTTAIVYLFYIANDLRRRLDKSEKIVRDLHQELSIRLSNTSNGKN